MNLNTLSNDQINNLLTAEAGNVLDPSRYTNKTLEQLRQEQSKEITARYKHQPNTQAISAYWQKVNKLGKSKTQDYSSIAAEIQKDIRRPQKQKQRIKIDTKDAKRLFWEILQTIIAEENKNRPAEKQRTYIVDQHNKEILQHLVLYLINDSSSKYALEKGLFLFGLTGRGKTLLMRAAKYFTKHLEQLGANTQQIKIVNCKTIVRQVAEAKTIAPINQYLQQVYCFDDLGYEENYKLFGNGINAMREILTERYEAFNRSGLTTHATSNLLPAQIAERYGERIASRFSQMFNYIFLDGEQDFRTVK